MLIKIKNPAVLLTANQREHSAFVRETSGPNVACV